MRFVLGSLSALLGLVAGWFALALAVITLAGPDRDGGIAMGAFFQIGPIGGIVGAIVGVWLFRRFGLGRTAAGPNGPTALVTPPGGESPIPDATATVAPTERAISRPFAVVVVALAAGLSWWAWYEFVRSPYLSHGFMTLELQFRLPPGMALPASRDDVMVVVEEGDRAAMVTVPEAWRAHEGDRAVVLARAGLYVKARRRMVMLTLANDAQAVWRLDLASDPDPTSAFTPWRDATGEKPGGIEMNYRLTADR